MASTDARVPPGAVLVAPAEFGVFDLLADLAHASYIAGFSEQAVASCRQWVALTEAAGDRETTRYLRYIEAVALQERGRYDDALRVASDLIVGLGDDLLPIWRAKATSIVAEASMRLGRPGRAIAALAEADWLIRSIPQGSYGHLSASMAVALALRSVNLLEQADEALSAIRGGGNPEVDVLVAQELALLSTYWGTALQLVGRDEATSHYVTAASRALWMQRLAREVGDEQMQARGEVIEAHALLSLGFPELARARVVGAAHRFTPRPELLETHLFHLVLGRTAAAAGDLGEAREHFEILIHDAEVRGREIWAATARTDLADVETANHNEHRATELWRTIARTALGQVWSEREGRFAALRDRDRLRELTAETHRIGQVVLEDHLTGLGNRRLLSQFVSRRRDDSWAIFVDIDDFKRINDRFSHAIGDDVLRRLAAILRAECRQADLVARYGGDEFVVLPNGGRDAAMALAHRIHLSVQEERWDALVAGLAVTISVGVGQGMKGTSDALLAADAALLRAKSEGRDRVAVLYP